MMMTSLASRRYMSGEQFDALGRAYTHTQLEALRRSDAFVGWCASHALCTLHSALSPSIRPSSRPAADSQWPVALAPPAYLSCLYSASVICVLCSAPPLRYMYGMAGCAAGQLSTAVLPPLTMTTTKLTTTMIMMAARVCAVNEAITVPEGARAPSAARGPAGLPSEIHLCPRLAALCIHVMRLGHDDHGSH